MKIKFIDYFFDKEEIKADKIYAYSYYLVPIMLIFLLILSGLR